MGKEHAITTLMRAALLPLARALYGGRGGGGHPAAGFDAHHSFVVKYAAETQTHLAPHTDDSDVTFNTCLGRDGFEGSGLVFCGALGAPDHRRHSLTFEHKIGTCVVHLGSRRHGSDTIAKGERCNLIVWCRSLAWRESPAASAVDRLYATEDAPPDPVCVSYQHDRDSASFVPYPDAAAEASFRGQSWCPPRGKEYAGFEEEDPLEAAAAP